jgi:hypothetical protein
MEALAIKIFKIIFKTKIQQKLMEKAQETESEIDDKFVLSLIKFLDSL